MGSELARPPACPPTTCPPACRGSTGLLRGTQGVPWGPPQGTPGAPAGGVPVRAVYTGPPQQGDRNLGWVSGHQWGRSWRDRPPPARRPPAGCAGWARNPKGPQVTPFCHQMGRHPTIWDFKTGIRHRIPARISPCGSRGLNPNFSHHTPCVWVLVLEHPVPPPPASSRLFLLCLEIVYILHSILRVNLRTNILHSILRVNLRSNLKNPMPRTSVKRIQILYISPPEPMQNV